MTPANKPAPTNPYTPYADPAAQPTEYFHQAKENWHEANSTLAEGFVYAATEDLLSCWPTAHKVVYEHAGRYDSRLEFVRIEDASHTTIATPDDLHRMIGDDDEHPALLGVQFLATAYTHWQAGGTRADERGWKVTESEHDRHARTPHFVTYTLPTLTPEAPAPRREGLIRRVRVGAGEVRTYDMGSRLDDQRRWIGHYRQTMNIYGVTASVEYNELEPGVLRVTVEGDPASMKLSINGTLVTPASPPQQQARSSRKTPPAKAGTAPRTPELLNREALAYNHDDAGPTVEYPGARIFVWLTDAGDLGLHLSTEEVLTDPSLATPDDLPPLIRVHFYRDDRHRFTDDPLADRDEPDA